MCSSVALYYSLLSENKIAFFKVMYIYSFPYILFLKLYVVGLGKRRRNSTTGFIYGVLRADSLKTGIDSKDNLPKL